MHLNPFEMRHLRAHVLAQIDAVTVRARLSRGHHAEEFRMVLAHERTVVGVAARCQKHGRSADAIQARVLAFDQNARHGAVLIALKTNHLRVDANICTGLFQRGLHFFDHVATDAARLGVVHARSLAAAVNTRIKVELAAQRFEPFESRVALFGQHVDENLVVRAFADLQRILSEHFGRVVDAGGLLLLGTGNIHAACGQQRAAADNRHFFQHDGLKAFARSFNGRSNTRAARTDHHKVSLFRAIRHRIAID